MFQLSKNVWLLLPIFLYSCDTGNKQSVAVDSADEIKKEKQEIAPIADAAFKDGMTGKVFHNYLQLRTALVNGDVEGARTASSDMAEAFTEERAVLLQLGRDIAESDNLEQQRKLFYSLSQKLEPLFKGNLDSGTIYKLYCPMAFDNKGAFWFSEVKQIANPYFGDKMLRCGSVQEEING